MNLPSRQSPGLSAGTQVKHKAFQKTKRNEQKGTPRYVSSADYKKGYTVLKPRALCVNLGDTNWLGKKQLFVNLDSSEHGEEWRDERSA